ncbi:MAG TPA: hypothetical protein VFC16_05360, partial [Nakamurella sp.]|nr:hypothetical protein [Nakamurella sp.]
MPRSSLDRVYRALDEQGRQPRLRGTHIQARCPLHEDATPSLSIDWKSASGMTLLACHSGSCPAADEKDILEALGLRLTDRFDAPLPDRPQPSARSRRAS